MSDDEIYKASLEYHAKGRPGKIAVVPTKPTLTQRDLSLAYSPGVAEPCREIARQPNDAYRYTSKGNLVAVISNGTAILGIGNLGALASKPVMEGKGVLFKRFADIDVFDIEVNTEDIDEFCNTVALLEPTFGGINLEDVKAPECFEIEKRLKERMNIPVFHDDQHGTAIISGAALVNALELVQKNIGDIRIVVNGAGASGIACTLFAIQLGVKPENVILCDTKGVIHSGRTDLNPVKQPFAVKTDARTLDDALKGADVFYGLSSKGALKAEALKTMARDPIVFAMANPEPEIEYDVAMATRSDVIMATGRSDYPNQVNNVLGFPFIFRGALDTRATAINEEMKIAASKALARLAKAEVPDSVSRAYGGKKLKFGRDYLIPTPFDPRVLYYVAPAVAQAAMDSGVARIKLNVDEYRERLRVKTEPGRAVMSVAIHKAQELRKRLALPDGADARVLSVARQIIRDGVARPVLIGDREKIAAAMKGFSESEFEIIDAAKPPSHAVLQQRFKERAGMFADKAMDSYALAALMTDLQMVDGMLSAADRIYRETVPNVLRFVSKRSGTKRVIGMHIMVLPNRVLFFADTTLNVDPDAEVLADCGRLCSEAVLALGITPRVAFISYNNFGADSHPQAQKVRNAYELFKQQCPGVQAIGEVQADIALSPGEFRNVIDAERWPEPANVLIFPDLDTANAAFRLVRVTADATALGPLLLGLKRPANVMPRGSTVQDAVAMAAVTLAMPVLATGSGMYPAVK
ncbi:MAG: NADP-dependent malic enzyme [Planctomycetes bacterium]|nr:NADP-dependent malic enzyme [Planctomycetota bacterium]MCW8135369.1 NADP-dependent malic enzyme [Planctomycetota bacterium]